jgi:uncharacterized protein
MQIFITGASGLIGTHLFAMLKENNYEVIALSRNPNHTGQVLKDIKVIKWDPQEKDNWIETINGDFAVINLAGENISKGRWTDDKKSRIIDSRVETSKLLTESIIRSCVRPKVFIQASAIGYYDGYSGNLCTESSPKGNRFLSDMVYQWEESVKQLNDLTRLVIIRSGVVLSNKGGAFPSMILPFRFYAGGAVGSGKQWLSWIHIKDELNAIKFILENFSCNGIFNLVAPNPITNEEFAKIAGKTLSSPPWLKVPAFMIKLLFGEMGKELLLSGEKVIPEKLLKAGFTFSYSNLSEALQNLLYK